MDILKRKSAIHLDTPLHLVQQGQIGRLQLVDEHLRTPTQLKQRLEELRQRFKAIQTRRTTRSFGTGNENDEPETLKARRLRVGNLIYKGQLISGKYGNSGIEYDINLFFLPNLQATFWITQNHLC